MATLTADAAAATAPVYGTGPAGNMKVAFGQYSFVAGVATADIIEMCKVPAASTILGGDVMAGDLDSNATETLDINAGWAINDDEAADTDGFGNFGLWPGDVVTDIIPVAGNWKPLQGVLLTTGPKTFTADTTLTLEIVADAATAVAGVLTMVAYYAYNV